MSLSKSKTRSKSRSKTNYKRKGGLNSHTKSKKPKLTLLSIDTSSLDKKYEIDPEKEFINAFGEGAKFSISKTTPSRLNLKSIKIQPDVHKKMKENPFGSLMGNKSIADVRKTIRKTIRNSIKK